MTATRTSPDGTGAAVRGGAGAVRLPAGPAPAVLPVTRGAGDRTRTIGVVLVDPAGARWQRTPDLDRLAAVATVTAGTVAAVACVAAAMRRPAARVDRLTMGPGGWVSFKGGARPRSPRRGRRPWWAALLRAWPLDR